jgi:chromosome segregation ATPase
VQKEKNLYQEKLIKSENNLEATTKLLMEAEKKIETLESLLKSGRTSRELLAKEIVGLKSKLNSSEQKKVECEANLSSMGENLHASVRLLDTDVYFK